MRQSWAVDPSLQRQAREAHAEVVSGALRGPALLERLLAVPYAERDAWLDELLGIAELPPDAPDLPRGAVPYLPCGVEAIVAMVREAPVGAGDVLVDLGAGLGRPLILAHLLSGARGHGIELQLPLVRSARQRCDALGLGAVSIVHGDAGETALDGSVFFLYAPCNGAMLARVVDRVAEVAERRPIVVATVDLELHGAAWLRPRTSSCSSLMLYDSLPPASSTRNSTSRLRIA